MTGLIALLLVGGAVLFVRARTTRRAHKIVGGHLTPGPDGIIGGASAIDLPGDGRYGLLLLHGFGDTPQTLRYLADHMHSQGWGVRAPLLPGHGRTLDEFAASRAAQWVDFAREELVALRARYESVAIVGLSMGGAIATILAGDARDVRALVLLAPYLSMPTRLRRAADAYPVLGVLFPFLRGGGDRSIRDPIEAARNLAYGFATPRLVFELRRVVDRARAAAPAVSAPTLVVQSRQDNRIPPEAAERSFSLFRILDRRLLWTEGNGHIITVDYGREVVFTAVADWLETHARRSGNVSSAPSHSAEPRAS